MVALLLPANFQVPLSLFKIAMTSIILCFMLYAFTGKCSALKELTLHRGCPLGSCNDFKSAPFIWDLIVNSLIAHAYLETDKGWLP